MVTGAEDLGSVLVAQRRQELDLALSHTAGLALALSSSPAHRQVRFQGRDAS